MIVITILGGCLFCLWGSSVAQGQNLIETINFAGATNVQLGLCGDDIILTVRSFLVQTDEFGGQFGDRCDTTSTFAAFCEATVRCRFTQTEYRAEIRHVCGAAYDQAQMIFAYNCLPASSPKSIVGLNTNLNRNTLHYLKSQNFDGIPDDSANDDSTTCVVTPADEQTFTASVFRANAFTDAAEFTTGQLEVYGRIANGEAVTYRPLAPAGLRASGLTRQSVNYTDLLRVPLENLNFTYTKGDDNLSFLMQLQATARLTICCRAVNESHPWESCDPVTPPPLPDTTTVQDQSGEASSRRAHPAALWVPVAIAAGLLLASGVTVAAVLRRRHARCCTTTGTRPSHDRQHAHNTAATQTYENAAFASDSPSYENAAPSAGTSDTNVTVNAVSMDQSRTRSRATDSYTTDGVTSVVTSAVSSRVVLYENTAAADSVRSSTESQSTQMDGYEYIDMAAAAAAAVAPASQYETPVFDTSGDYERPYTTLN